MLNSYKLLITSDLFLWRNPLVSEDDSLCETPKSIWHFFFGQMKSERLAAAKKFAGPFRLGRINATCYKF